MLECESPSKQVRNFIHSQKLVVLLETKVKPQNVGILYQNVFQSWCFTSNANVHKGGRIVVGWNPLAFLLSILVCSSQLIHCVVQPVSGPMLLLFCLCF